MATDAYLQLDGIKGESSDDQHKEWVEIMRCNWGIIQPKSSTASTSGGHTAGRCEHRPITIMKLTDISSPKLMQLSSSGATIPKAKIEFLRADGDGRVTFFEMELQNVLIASINPTFDPEIGLIETVSLAYSQVKWVYTKQKISGGAGGKGIGGWNLSSNKVAA